MSNEKDIREGIDYVKECLIEIIEISKLYESASIKLTAISALDRLDCKWRE